MNKSERLKWRWFDVVLAAIVFGFMAFMVAGALIERFVIQPMLLR